MTDDFLWGGINIRKFCSIFFRNFWMIIAIMIITYLGLALVDEQTYTPRYITTAVVAVYPESSSYRYHTIENASYLSSKTEDINSVFNSDLFQSGLQIQEPSLKDCTIDSVQVANTDLLVMHAISSKPENAFNGIPSALNYYSQFSGDITGAPEIRIILGPKAPFQVDGDSKIHRYRSRLPVLAGLMMAGFLLFMYIAKKTYKTEHSIRNRYKNVRFFSMPLIKSKSEKKNSQMPIRKLALEIKQVLYKYDKKSLFITSFADKEGGSAFISELAKELAEQDENVILIETEELKVHCHQYGPDSIDEVVSYSIDDVGHVLSECMSRADIVLVNGTAWHPSHYAQIWHEAVDASIALCRQDDADFFKVDKMLRDLQEGDTYFAGCVLFGF